jgi:hypothetical protein
LNRFAESELAEQFICRIEIPSIGHPFYFSTGGTASSTDARESVINPPTVIRVFQHTHLGRLIGFSIVLLILHADEWIDVGRFDSAHGTPHRDILGKTKGLPEKLWYDELTAKQVFALAISTFRKNHVQISNDFLAN